VEKCRNILLKMFYFGVEDLNPGRLGGDIAHLLAVLTLLVKLGYTKSACGMKYLEILPAISMGHMLTGF